MDVSEAIRAKRAVREFAATPLPVELVSRILHAGRRAQSSKNTQPWQFIAIQDRPALQALSRLGKNAGHLAGAAVGVAILTPDPAERWSVLFDAGQAAAYMQLAAWEMGVGSCLATIYDSDGARSLLGFPDDLVCHVALSFGYPADPSVMQAPPKPGGRKVMENIVHFERWRAD